MDRLDSDIKSCPFAFLMTLSLSATAIVAILVALIRF
tara:strand:+ start:74 stop:184 length:111 start_codon:yes stop_codon:yes gene_type:complete